MTEERFEITWTLKKTELMTRRDIEAGAQVGLGAFGAACREWLTANPERGMTHEEFDKLPDGSVVKVNGLRYLGLRYLVWDGVLIEMENFLDPDEFLDVMSVVSTPAPPSLDDVHVARDKNDELWYRQGELWYCATSASSEYHDRFGERYGPLTPLIPGPQIGGRE